MRTKKVKKELLEELAKDGIVLSACKKVGINRSTYYRWLETDSLFRNETNTALNMGRKNGIDYARLSLFQLIKKGNIKAIEWFQRHNDPIYMPKKEEASLLLEKEGKRMYYEGYSEALRAVTESMFSQDTFTEVNQQSISENVEDQPQPTKPKPPPTQ